MAHISCLPLSTLFLTSSPPRLASPPLIKYCASPASGPLHLLLILLLQSWLFLPSLPPGLLLTDAFPDHHMDSNKDPGSCSLFPHGTDHHLLSRILFISPTNTSDLWAEIEIHCVWLHQSPAKAAHCQSFTDRYNEQMRGDLESWHARWHGLRPSLCPEGTG